MPPAHVPTRTTHDDGTRRDVLIPAPDLIALCDRHGLTPVDVLTDVRCHDDGSITLLVIVRDDDDVPLIVNDDFVTRDLRIDGESHVFGALDHACPCPYIASCPGCRLAARHDRRCPSASDHACVFPAPGTPEHPPSMDFLSPREAADGPGTGDNPVDCPGREGSSS